MRTFRGLNPWLRRLLAIIVAESAMQGGRRSSMYRFALFGLCLFASLGAAAENAAKGSAETSTDSTASATLDQILATAATYQTASGTFVQKTYRRDEADAQAGTTHDGTFYLRRPQAYDVTFTKPDDAEYVLRLISDGSQQWTVEQIFSDQIPDVSTRAVEAGEGMGQQLARLMRFDRAALEESFTLREELLPEEQKPSGIRVHLKPRDPELAAQLGTVQVDLTAAGRVASIVIDDPQGNRTVLTILGLEYDAPLPTGVFTWPAP